MFLVVRIALLLALAGSGFVPSNSFDPPALVPWGLELPVQDVQRAEQRYTSALGFRSVFSGGEVALLEKDGLRLVLSRSDAPLAPAGSAGPRLELATGSLDATLERALAAGFALAEPDPESSRSSDEGVALVDPDGHATRLVERSDPRLAAPDSEPVLVDVALELEAEAATDFLDPLTLSSAPAGETGVALVVRRNARGPRPGGTRAAALLLAVEDLEPALPPLVSAGLAGADALPRATSFGRRLALRVPSGVRVELVERSAAQLAFEHLWTLAGSWEGRSSAGWTARAEIEVIARGSAVLERTNFEAHPGETMLTLFHRDGPELLLTHYCVAGNQPRLVAVAPAQGELHFTFRDGTNLASRDQGHMDEARFRFEDPDAFSSTWSFFQGGKTSWMEEIHYRRLVPGTQAAEAVSPPPHQR